MGAEPLVTEQIDAGDEFARTLNDSFAIAAAFWLNPADSERWYFYLASSQITDANKRAVYGEIVELLKQKDIAWLDAFQVKLLNAADPLARKIVEIRDQYPASIATRYNGSSVAGMAIDGAYIYPPIAATSSTP